MQSKFIVITRPENESEELKKEIEKLGVKVFLSPTISITKSNVDEKMKQQLQSLDSYDWIVFTSRNGVRFFLQTLEELHIAQSILRKKFIAAVGLKTAEEIKKHRFSITLLPDKFTTKDLGTAFKDIKDKKILLPRATIATPTLPKQLKEKGAIVVNIPIYKTDFLIKQNKEFETLLEQNHIICITFTSPSTVKGLVHSLTNTPLLNKIFALPVVSIGPVTTKAAKKYGFTNIYTANPHTTKGLLTKIQENIL